MRTKKVFETSQIPHVWANQLQAEGRNSGGNLYFNGPTIYSYGSHFPIASMVERDGKKSVLFTTRGYSNTTAKHIGIVRSACSQYNLIYCHNPESALRGGHSENVERFEQEAKNWAGYLPKSRKPEKYLVEIERERVKAEKYAEFFKLNLSKFGLSFLYTASKNDYAGKLEQAEAVRKEREKKRMAEAKRKEKAELRKFKAFESNRVYGAEFSYLRFNKETNRIETSQQIEIPLEIAKRTFKWLQTVLKGGGCTECNFKVLEYEVQTVSKDLFTVGCHKIPITEVKAIQKQLGW